MPAAPSLGERQGVITCILARHSTEALALGRSLALNSPQIARTCVVEGALTPEVKAALSEAYTELVPLRPEHHRMGWLVKHVMAEYSPYSHTLFLDSDCLVLRDLRPAFADAGGRTIAFATKAEPNQEAGKSLFAGIELSYLLRRFAVDWWPQILGGGHFFFRQGPETRAIFERARYWGQPQIIREFGWKDPKKTAPDELTLQIALVEAGLGRACALVDYPLVCWTPPEAARPDVFRQQISLKDLHSGRRRIDRQTFVAHFGGDASNPNFRREQWRLSCWAKPNGQQTRPGLAQISKPFFHLYAHLSRKSRHGWQRLQRTWR
jgi:hypothetical protein